MVAVKMYKKVLRKIVKISFFVLLLLIVFRVLSNLIVHFDRYQWDFLVYYSAANAFAANANPYDSETLAKFAPFNVELNFVYPPPSLWFFRLFTLMDYRSAFCSYLFFKVLLLIGLLYLWVKKFLMKERKDWLFYVFTLLAFNGTIYADIISGNISIIEQFLLWSGFYFYLIGRYFLFCVLLCGVSLFKVTFLLFLCLLWLTNSRKRGIYFLGTLSAFSFIMILSYLDNPSLFAHFLKNIIGLDERGMINPSSLALIRDIEEVIKEKMGLSLPAKTDLIIFLGFVLTIVIFSLKAIKTLIATSFPNRKTWEILFSCFIYALILPRFKNYSYILLIVPAYYIIKNTRQTNLAPLLFALPSLPFFIWDYFPWITAFIFWLIYLKEISLSMPQRKGE